jgi:hypothetical protein
MEDSTTELCERSAWVASKLVSEFEQLANLPEAEINASERQAAMDAIRTLLTILQRLRAYAQPGLCKACQNLDSVVRSDSEWLCLECSRRLATAERHSHSKIGCPRLEFYVRELVAELEQLVNLPEAEINASEKLALMDDIRAARTIGSRKA